MRILTSVSLVLSLATLFSCRSPLAHHIDESDLPDPVAQAAVPAGQCDLAFTAQNLCARMEWTRKPVVGSDDGEPLPEFRIRLFERRADGTEGAPVNFPAAGQSGFVAVKLWMPGMGHGSSPVKVAQETETDGEGTARPLTGRYLAREVYFSMPGHWEIWLQLKDGNKSVIEQHAWNVQL